MRTSAANTGANMNRRGSLRLEFTAKLSEWGKLARVVRLVEIELDRLLALQEVTSN